MNVTPGHNQHPAATECLPCLATDEGADIAEQRLNHGRIAAGTVQGHVGNHTHFASVTLTPEGCNQITALRPHISGGEEERGRGGHTRSTKEYQSIAGHLKEMSIN